MSGPPDEKGYLARGSHLWTEWGGKLVVGHLRSSQLLDTIVITTLTLGLTPELGILSWETLSHNLMPYKWVARHDRLLTPSLTCVFSHTYMKLMKQLQRPSPAQTFSKVLEGCLKKMYLHGLVILSNLQKI